MIMAELGKAVDEKGLLKSDKIAIYDFMKEMDLIKMRRHDAEKKKSSVILEKFHVQSPEFHDSEKHLDRKLQNEIAKIDEQLKAIKAQVTEFLKELKIVKPTEESIKKLKETMNDIESTITIFKENEREIVQSLAILEKETEQELQIFEGKVEALNEISELLPSSRVGKVRVRPRQSDFPKEIKEFEDFVSQHGGLQGGWDDFDHGLFLKVRKKFKDSESFIAAAFRQIPGRSFQDIEDHEKWYARFLELRRQKKEYIAVWRKKKDEEANNQSNCLVQGNVWEEKEKSLPRVNENEQKLKRDAVLVWKAHKQEEKLQEEKRRLEMKQRMIELEEKRRKARKLEMDKIRATLKEKQEEENRLHWLRELDEEHSKREQQLEIRANLSAFQKRDQMALSTKMERQKRQEEMDLLRKERLEKMKKKVHVETDRTRLYKLTEGWRNRKHDCSESEHATHIKLPHRAIPSWRQNL